MNAIELLKKDHETVKSLFESFEKAKEQEQEANKAELFASIKEELDAHARVEEEIFYPAFDRAAEEEDDKELVLEAGEEHKQVKTLLAELAGLEPDDETFDAKMKVLKDNIEHHVEEEEGEMFPHAQKRLGSDALEELGSRIAARKEQIQQEAKGRPAGRAPAARAVSGRRSSRVPASTPARRRSTTDARPSSTRGRKSTAPRASASSRRAASSRRSSSSGRRSASSSRKSATSRGRSSRSD